MSTTRLMVLGLVSWLQPVHGYDIRKELLSWDVESWANIQPGSIYHALRKMSEEGLLEEVGTERVDSRPARTSYRITAAGEREFQTLLRKYWWEPQTPVDPFLAALSFMPALARPEAAAALRERARHLERIAEEFRREGPTWAADKPAHVGWQFELTVVKCEAEARWCHDVAARVEAGEGLHVTEVQPSFADEWRASLRVEYGEVVDDEGDEIHGPGSAGE